LPSQRFSCELRDIGDEEGKKAGEEDVASLVRLGFAKDSECRNNSMCSCGYNIMETIP
jgi:hypothetical protein